jgi:hypothetical protein
MYDCYPVSIRIISNNEAATIQREVQSVPVLIQVKMQNGNFRKNLHLHEKYHNMKSNSSMESTIMQGNDSQISTAGLNRANGNNEVTTENLLAAKVRVYSFPLHSVTILFVVSLHIHLIPMIIFTAVSSVPIFVLFPRSNAEDFGGKQGNFLGCSFVAGYKSWSSSLK